MTAAEKKKYTKWALWGGGGLLVLYLLTRSKKASAAPMAIQQPSGGKLSEVGIAPRFGVVEGQCQDLVEDMNVDSNWCLLQDQADASDTFFYPR